MKKYFATISLIGVLIFSSVIFSSPQQTQAATSGVTCTVITADLWPNSKDSRTQGQVSKLQNFLIAEGYLNASPTGNVGPLTESALQAFQKAQNIVSSGNYMSTGYGATGPKTRTAIKNVSCGGGTGAATSVSLLPLGCLVGYKFNTLTGQLCTTSLVTTGSTSSIPGCNPGALFSTLTGQSCSGSSNTTVVTTISGAGTGSSGGTSGNSGNNSGSGNTQTQTQTQNFPAGTILVPGTGFTGVTSQPSAIGSGAGSDAEAIARWDVVPFQTFTGNFNVGVIAFHINGIDHVAFSVNGGPWTNISQMTLNPQTNVAEYWATVRASDFSDGQVEIRAIAYPKVGIPRVLAGPTGAANGNESVFLFADANGTLPSQILWVSTTGSDTTGNGTQAKPFATILKAVQNAHDGATINVQAGSYDFTQANPIVQTNNTRWITIAGAPGVDKTQVTIQPKQILLGVSRLALSNLTVNEANGGSELEGCYYCNSHNPTDLIWIDNSVITSSLGRDHTPEIGQPVDMTSWMKGYITNTSLHDYPGRAIVGINFVRNVTIEKIADDAIDNPDLVVNTTIDDVVAGNEGDHIDAVQYFPNRVDDNSIVYNVKATNVDGQMLFGSLLSPSEGGPASGVLENVAVVNYAGSQLQTYGASPAASQVGDGNHMLYYNITLPAQPFFLTSSSGSGNQVLADSIVYALFPDNSPSTISLQNDRIISNNLGNPLPSFGTYTTGDPSFVTPLVANSSGVFTNTPDFHLSPSSPVRGQVPTPFVPYDIENTARFTPDAIGAYTASPTIQTPAPAITLSATPTSVTSGSASSLSWSTTNASACTASGGWSGSQQTSGTQTTGALTTNTTYTLSCTGPGGSSQQSVTVSVTAPVPPSQTAVNRWTFDSSTISGTNVQDVAGSINGTLVGSPSSITGQSGQALSFNGSNQYVSLSSSASVLNQGANPYSISMWVNPTSYSSCNSDGCGIIRSIGNSGNGQQGDFFVSLTSSGNVQFGNWQASSNQQTKYGTTSTIPTGSWSNIVAVWNGTSNTIYINGVSQTLFSPPGFTGTGFGNGTYIGTNYTALPAWYFNGAIDDVRIYNRALSGSEVSQLYAGTLSSIQTPANSSNLANVLTSTLNLLPHAIPGTSYYNSLINTLNSALHGLGIK